jgi:hypothetical protein
MVYLENGDCAELTRDRLPHHALRRHAGRTSRERIAAVGRRRRTRPVPALHAEGDLRAAGGPGQYARNARYRRAASSPACSAPRARKCSRMSAGADHRLRHQLPRRPGGALLARSDRRHPVSVESRASTATATRCPIPQTLVVTISQSGETADTLAALQHAKALGMTKRTLCICNVPESSLVRENSLRFITRAGPEIGVASTKAFTTQLAALYLLTLVSPSCAVVSTSAGRGRRTACGCATCRWRSARSSNSSPRFANGPSSFSMKQHALFLGRGRHYPIAMEGALKLKEISYIHAEAYPAGELKHGPLALVDKRHAGHRRRAQRRAAGKAQVESAGSARARRRTLRLRRRRQRDEGVGRRSRPAPARALRRAVGLLHVVPLQLLAYHVAWCAAPTSTSRAIWRSR